MNPRSPTLKAIVATDFLALIGAITPLIGLAMTAVSILGVLPNKDRSLAEGRLVMSDPWDWSLAAFFLLLGLTLLGWRWSRIRGAFESGTRVAGTVTALRPFKDRAYVHYEYVVGSECVKAVQLVHQSKAYQQLSEGLGVTVAVDPRRPKAGFLVELFGEPAPGLTR